MTNPTPHLCLPARPASRRSASGPPGGPALRLPRRPAALTTALLAAAALTACAGDTPPAEQADGLTAFTGATVWDGTGAPPLANATLLVRDGRIVSVEVAGEVPDGAEEVDLAGRYVIPGLIDAHAHLNGLWADPAVTDEAARLEAALLLFARYGVTTINSLGGAPAAAGPLRDATPGEAPGRARFTFAGAVVTGPTPEDAVEQVAANAEQGVDWIKIRVDDNLGTADKMPWPAVEATIEAAHERGLRVASYLFYLEDAERLMELGTDLVAHSVRDAAIPSSLSERLAAEGVCYVPTLTREVVSFVYAERPDWFDDPVFQRWANAEQVAAVTDPDFQARMAASSAAARYREALLQAQENLATLHRAGAPIAFGTDSGPGGRFPGYLQHLELELMVEGGLSPEEALITATSQAAACLGNDDVGVLEAGRLADFVVLEADPLADVANTKTLEAVYVGGGRIQ
jgi:imidazolonepropionase-like amidohydrolase